MIYIDPAFGPGSQVDVPCPAFMAADSPPIRHPEAEGVEAPDWGQETNPGTFLKRGNTVSKSSIIYNPIMVESLIPTAFRKGLLCVRKLIIKAGNLCFTSDLRFPGNCFQFRLFILIKLLPINYTISSFHITCKYFVHTNSTPNLNLLTL